MADFEINSTDHLLREPRPKKNKASSNTIGDLRSTENNPNCDDDIATLDNHFLAHKSINLDVLLMQN